MAADGDSSIREYRPQLIGLVLSILFGIAFSTFGVYLSLTAVGAFGLKPIPGELGASTPPNWLATLFGGCFVVFGIVPAAIYCAFYRNARVFISEGELRVVDWRGREQFREPWSNVRNVLRISDDGAVTLVVTNGRQSVTIPSQLAGLGGLEEDLRARTEPVHSLAP
jgi:hypothetical protein